MKIYFCSHCGKQTKVKVPKGGDGSLTIPIVHNLSNINIICPGSWEEAEERDVRVPAKKKK